MEMEYINQIRTPFYLFDKDILRKRIDYLRSSLPKEVSLCYAVKANPFLIKEAEPFVERLEICSPGEAEICKALAVPAEKMVISGVYKTPEVIEGLMDFSDKIGVYTVESMQHLNLLREKAAEKGKKISVFVRLTSGNQFGVSKDELIQIVKSRNEFTEIEIRGIQYFSGTQKQSIKKLRREIEMLDNLLSELAVDYGLIDCELEYGTGFPVSYFRGENFDEPSFLQEFSALLSEMKNKPHITLELGRSIAASCGTYYTRVVDTKQNKNGNYAIVDGGMHQIAYYGQMMAMKVPYVHLLQERGKAAGTEEGKGEENWNICGSLCTINDILVKQLPIKDLQTGDVIAFENAGAYCMTEGISLFLSRDIPAVVLKETEDEYRILRQHIEMYPENLPDYKL